MNKPARVPLKPDYSAFPNSAIRASASATKSAQRMLASVALAALTKESPAMFVARTWPDDNYAAVVTRAASSPTSTTTAPDLVPSLTSTILTGIAPQSAAVKLFAACLQLDFSTAHQISNCHWCRFAGLDLGRWWPSRVVDPAVCQRNHRMV